MTNYGRDGIAPALRGTSTGARGSDPCSACKTPPQAGVLASAEVQPQRLPALRFTAEVLKFGERVFVTY